MSRLAPGASVPLLGAFCDGIKDLQGSRNTPTCSGPSLTECQNPGSQEGSSAGNNYSPAWFAEISTVQFLLKFQTSSLTNTPSASETFWGTAGARTSALSLSGASLAETGWEICGISSLDHTELVSMCISSFSCDKTLWVPLFRLTLVN